uniref:Uncharacterized protein n=1 Tax=Knipowitschia caucasica TaxID=637954 RepID=A0AAV2JQ30_KNICA
MNPVSVGEYHGLRVGSSLLSIVAGCVMIGISRECDADAVGGIFLGAGGLGNRVQPAASNPIPEQTLDTLRREGTQSQLNVERTKSRMGTFVEGGRPGENPDEGYKNVP